MVPLLWLAGLVIYVYCVFDVLFTDETTMRNLPKPLWALIVILAPPIGPIAWLVAGRPQGKPFTLGDPTSDPQRRASRPPQRPRGAPPRGPEDSPEYGSRVEEERLRRWEDELRRREEELRRREGGDPT